MVLNSAAFTDNLFQTEINWKCGNAVISGGFFIIDELKQMGWTISAIARETIFDRKNIRRHQDSRLTVLCYKQRYDMKPFPDFRRKWSVQSIWESFTWMDASVLYMPRLTGVRYEMER